MRLKYSLENKLKFKSLVKLAIKEKRNNLFITISRTKFQKNSFFSFLNKSFRKLRIRKLLLKNLIKLPEIFPLASDKENLKIFKKHFKFKRMRRFYKRKRIRRIKQKGLYYIIKARRKKQITLLTKKKKKMKKMKFQVFFPHKLRYHNRFYSIVF